MKTIDIKVERTIPASPEEVFDGWLNPNTPGTPWSENDKLLFDPKVDGMFYWLYKSIHAHFGRFTEINRKEGRLAHTWMSRHTSGLETSVLITFKKKGSDTLMTILHTGLPDDEGGRGHEEGWTYFTGKFGERFGK